MADVNLKVPALEKLVDYAASGIGAVAGPMLASWRARQSAKAKLIGAQADADSLRLIADAQADARRSLVASVEAGGGVLEIGPDSIAQRIEFQERKRQANIKSVVGDAAAELGEKEVPNHEPDPDWTARFFDCVQDVSAGDMRKLWARILSGEVEEPGRTSLRTLDILKNMTQKNAQIFRGICDFIIGDFVFYPQEDPTRHRALSFNNIIYLQNIGLVSGSPFLAKNLRFTKNNKQILLSYHNLLLKIMAKGNPRKVEVPEILLTDSGAELYRILECTAHMDYLQSFSSFLKGQNCELSYAHIIEALADGRLRHTNPFIPIEPKPEQFGGATS